MSDPTPPPQAIEAVTVEPLDYDEHGVPSFDFVRDRIERRHATSLGATELAAAAPEAQTAEEKFAEREEKAKAKLEELRRSLGADAGWVAGRE